MRRGHCTPKDLVAGEPTEAPMLWPTRLTWFDNISQSSWAIGGSHGYTTLHPLFMKQPSVPEILPLATAAKLMLGHYVSLQSPSLRFLANLPWSKPTAFGHHLPAVCTITMITLEINQFATWLLATLKHQLNNYRVLSGFHAVMALYYPALISLRASPKTEVPQFVNILSQDEQIRTLKQT